MNLSANVRLLLALPLLVPAAAQTFRSGPERASLIELYTSEGCSSCPAAEQWLARLGRDSRLWQRFVPVVFHVHYWDRLGWRDVFATPEFTRRQQAHAAAWQVSSVYTPCFVRDGVEWSSRQFDVEPPPARDAGRLELAWDSAGICQVVFTPARRTAVAFTASVALLGGGIVSPVRGGENAGRELRHEFVVLQLQTVPLEKLDERFCATIRFQADTRHLPAIARHALAGWVTLAGSLKPLQAAGGWLE